MQKRSPLNFGNPGSRRLGLAARGGNSYLYQCMVSVFSTFSSSFVLLQSPISTILCLFLHSALNSPCNFSRSLPHWRQLSLRWRLSPLQPRKAPLGEAPKSSPTAPLSARVRPLEFAPATTSLIPTAAWLVSRPMIRLAAAAASSRTRRTPTSAPGLGPTASRSLIPLHAESYLSLK